MLLFRRKLVIYYLHVSANCVTYHSDLVCELVQSSSVHDYQMQHVPFAGIFHLNVGAQPYEARHCSPSRSAGGQQQWRPALLVHSVYVGSLKTRSRESRRRPTKGWFVNGSYFYRGSSIAPITLDVLFTHLLLPVNLSGPKEVRHLRQSFLGTKKKITRDENTFKNCFIFLEK